MWRAEIDVYTYRQLIFDKGTKVIQWSKDSLYNKCCWNDWTSVCKKMRLDTDLTSLTKGSELHQRPKCKM